MMSRVIEALGRKRKCTNYRDGLSWRSIGGGDWLVHGPTPTSGVCVCVCFSMQRDWMHQRRMDFSSRRRRRRTSQPADVGMMFRASVHPACSVFENGGYLILIHSALSCLLYYVCTYYVLRSTTYPRTSESEAKAYGPCADRVNHR